MPLLYVPGNHDPSLRLPDAAWSPLQFDPPVLGPDGCENIDGRITEALGLRIAGLGGSLRYKAGPNQYSQAQMSWRAFNLEIRVRLKRLRNRRKLDILVTHAPPFGFAEAKDATHVGFAAFNRLIQRFQPLLVVHGHIHPYGRTQPERRSGATRVINVVPTRVIEIP